MCSPMYIIIDLGYAKSKIVLISLSKLKKKIVLIRYALLFICHAELIKYRRKGLKRLTLSCF
jgi:hypothetical protein